MMADCEPRYCNMIAGEADGFSDFVVIGQMPREALEASKRSQRSSPERDGRAAAGVRKVEGECDDDIREKVTVYRQSFMARPDVPVRQPVIEAGDSAYVLFIEMGGQL